jgi:leucyl aminopeptidase
MDADFDEELDSRVADVMQCTNDSKGDHILAARFLGRFVDADVPWIHVDLSSSERKDGLAHVPTEFTGFGVRFATHLLRDAQFVDRLGPR